MNMMKALLLALALSIPMAAMALTDDEYMDYTAALNDGNVKKVKQYLDSGDTNVNDVFFAWSPLQIAANKGQLPLVKLLVEKGADLNYVHPVTRMNALHMAASSNHPQVVKYLVSKGIDLDAKLKNDVSIIRVLRDLGHNDMVELLLAAGVKDDGCKMEKCL